MFKIFDDLRLATMMLMALGAAAKPALAQTDAATAPAPAASAPTPDQPAPAPAEPPAAEKLDRVQVLGATVGLRQTRANVKITGADLDAYPPGVSADKVLERVSGIQQGSSNAFGGDGFESTINMRGFGKDSVGFSVDGIPNGRTTLGGGSVPTRYFDASNLAGVDVSQSAGIVGAPSHQALVGHINYLTQDPEKRFRLSGEAAMGSDNYQRFYARIDSGELLKGVSSYLSVSRQRSVVSYVDDPYGVNERDHVDFKAVARLGGGSVVKFRSGWNDRRETSGTNIVTLAQFRANPRADGYTDSWTGVPSRDRNFRGLKGNPRGDWLTHLEGNIPLGAGLNLDAKVYYHTQDGTGKETGLGNGGFPGMDGSASSIYFRSNDYELERRGVLTELNGKQSELIDWRIGGWLENYKRGQTRRWYPVLDEAVGPAYASQPDFISEDKRWLNRMAMVYAANRSSFLEGRLKFDYGLSYMDNRVDYSAPIQDSRTSRFGFVNQARVDSGVLPKLGVVYAVQPNTEVFAGAARNAAAVTDATLEGNAAATLAAAQTVRDMDTADAFDLGLRHRGDNYALGVQAFSIKSKEVVAADIAGTLQSENVDQGRRIRGVEFTYNLRFDELRLYAAYTMQKGRYELSDVDAAGNPPRGFIRDGADLIGIAKRNLFSEVVWQPNEVVKLALNVRHTGSRPGYYANARIAGSGVDERLPSYTLLGLSGSLDFEKLRVGFNIENLTDKRYIGGIAPELLTTSSVAGRYFIGSPRAAILWVRAEY
ncbi:MAG TPA: TonB-dependent receptor [Methylibium sp.]|uniref:TonB-dependent receptor n=1 Tax=Methylibium sp. TaxID=2067992 RepID=UPI002DB5B357|nr:TonB-dependent receptor [Methylibium sp.]HEU4460280.1 TonB-dependent receptor [Methylibium sp.]